MVWNIKEFNKHKHEWDKNPVMSEKEVLKYTGLSKKILYILIKLDIISKYLYSHPKWKGHQRWVFDRFEIIAYCHEVGLRT